MTGTPGNYVVDGPMGMFGKGQSSKSFANGEAFYAYVDALRKLGRTVTVHEDHAPVFAVVEPLQRFERLSDFDMRKLSLPVSQEMANPGSYPFFAREIGSYVKVIA